MFRSIERHYANPKRECPVSFPMSTNQKKILWFTHGFGVECVKLLGRVRNHFSHQVRIATRNELENSASDDPDSTLFQDLFNLTINGYDEEDGYKAAKPIYSSLCLYRNTSKNNRGTLRNGDMTVFACSF